MKILITGDDGFVGKNLIDSFFENEPKTEIIGLSKKTIASNKVEKSYAHYSADINDVYNLNRILDTEKPNWIIHLSAEADVSRSYLYPYDFLRVNVTGTFNILEWLKYNTDTKMIYASTDEVFGEVHNAKETDRLHPINPYSASKAAAEQYIFAYNEAYDVDVRVIRPFNIFGRYQKTNRLFGKIITNALMDKPFNLFADTGNHKRGWIYAGNVYYAMKTIMDDNSAKGQDFNLKYDEHLSVDEVKDRILRTLHKEHLFLGYNSSDTRHKDDFFYMLNSEKIEKFRYKPKYTFEEGLDITIKWYKTNMQEQYLVGD